MMGVFKTSVCFIIFVSCNFCSGAYDNNPFLNPPVTREPSSLNPTNNNGPSIPTSVPTTSSTPSTTTSSTPSTNVVYGDLNSKCLQPRGQFPSFACNKYVNCWDGRATEQSCPLGLVFNANKGYCDYLPSTDCGKRSLEGIEITSVPAPLSPEAQSSVAPAANPYLRSLCQNSRGLFRGSSCNKFVNCWDENVVEIECPAGTLFSVKGYCDFAENVNCDSYTTDNFRGAVINVPSVQNSREIVQTQQTSTEEKSEFECPLEFGSFRDRHNCSRYYICAYYKVAATHVCPEGLNFSDILGLCDYSYRVDCSKEPQIFTKNSQVSQTQNQFGTEPKCSIDQGTFRDPQNCSMYHVCTSRKIVASYVCPEGFSYNDELGICDYSDRVDCSKPPKTFSVDFNNLTVLPDFPQDIMEKIRSCTPGSIFALNAQCSSACICREGMAEIVQCEEGLAYNPNINKCVSASLVKC